MDKTDYTWTVDCESDWGGRAYSFDNINQGLPIIFDTFKKYNIRGLFFISTEILKDNRNLVKEILRRGHKIGSHGHFHMQFKDKWRSSQDLDISKTILSEFVSKESLHYRAPKFNYVINDIYSNPFRHVSVLRRVWWNQSIPDRPIFYIHPFDLIEPKFAPNLYCKILYSRWKEVRTEFERLTSLYRGEKRLE